MVMSLPADAAYPLSAVTFKAGASDLGINSPFLEAMQFRRHCRAAIAVLLHNKLHPAWSSGQL